MNRSTLRRMRRLDRLLALARRLNAVRSPAAAIAGRVATALGERITRDRLAADVRRRLK